MSISNKALKYSSDLIRLDLGTFEYGYDEFIV